MTTRQQLIEKIPTHHTFLFKFALKLTGNAAAAEDLVQDTFIRAIEGIDRFQPGTNMPAWLITILRNKFKTDLRRKFRSVEDPEGHYAQTLKTQPNQVASLQWKDFLKALDQIPKDQRHALVLNTIHGFSYDETAQVCNVAVGTIKSRVHRARLSLRGLLPEEDMLFIAAAMARDDTDASANVA